MKLFVSTILIICLWASTSSASAGREPSGQPQKQLTVLSYNLRFGELASLEELAAFIAEQAPDIVALQEVDLRTYRERAPHQHGKDFVTELAYHTGMLSAYGKTIPYAGGYYGIAILSKYPMAKIERVLLPKTDRSTEQRAVLVADIEIAEGEYITFACTHLDVSGSEERGPQVEMLNQVLTARRYPVILAGDFNAQPHSPEIEHGMARWGVISDLQPTSPATAPRRTIDYIFCYPENRWTKISAITHQTGLSDHLPIQAVVELR